MAMNNSLAEVHPELVLEWSEKNLPLTPEDITFGSNKKVWWKGACGHEWQATTMLANSEFVALLKQANTDSSKMAEVIGVSEAQLRFVTNTASGMGLIKCGSVVIPFDNQISKDTDLYRLYNTNIHEKIAEQKKKEAMLQ